MTDLFRNQIRVDGEVPLLIQEEGTYRVLLNGKFFNPRKISSFEIFCESCENWHERKSLTYKLMLEVWECISCKNTGERNPFYGKSHSLELKERMSEERKGNWLIGDANPMKGKRLKDFMDDESYQAWKEKTLKNTQDRWLKTGNPFDNMKEYVGEESFRGQTAKMVETRANWSDKEKAANSMRLSLAQKRLMEKDPKAYREMKQRAGRESVASLGRKWTMNNLETAVSEWLSDNAIEHVYSPIMNMGENKTFQYDFILKCRRVLVECNGDYWHGNPDFYNLDGTESKRKLNATQIIKIAQDEEKLRLATNKGFTVLTIWENEVNQQNFSALEEYLK